MSGIRQFSTVIAAVMVLAPDAAVPVPGDGAFEEPRGVVDCLLPGPVRRVGGSIYQMPQFPERLPANECRVRGGDFLLYDRANYETSLNHWISQANTGDAHAMLYVAQIYEDGIGRDPDYATAAEWYRKSADAGNSNALISLAHLYKTGNGVALDLKAAQKLYSEAFGSDVPIPLDPTSVAGADQRVQTLVSEVDKVRQQKIAVELELAAANEQLESARDALNSTLAGDSKNAGAIKTLQADVSRQQAEIADYQARLASLATENKDLATLRKQLEHEKAQTAELRTLLADAEAAVEHGRTELQRQEAALDQTQNKFNEQLASPSIDATKLQAMSREIEQQRERVSALESRLRKAEEDKALYQALASESSTQAERVATLNAKIVMLEQESSAVESDYELQKGQLQNTQRQLEEQIMLAQEASRLSAEEIAARDEEIGRLKAVIARAEQESSRHRDDIDHLTQQSSELEALRADLEREQAQSNRLQELLAVSQGQYAQSTDQLAKEVAERTALQQDIEELQAKVATGDQASQVLLEQREREAQSSRAEIESLQASVKEAEDDLQQYRTQMADTAARQSEAVDNLRLAVSQSRAERAKLEERLASATRQLEGAEADLDLERQRVQDLQDQLRVARAEQSENSEALAEKQRQLDEQSRVVASRQQEIERLNEQAGRYLDQIAELQQVAESKKVEFVGPRIVMQEPDENLLTETTVATRGDDNTRGFAVVPATMLNESRKVSGRVEAPAGLATLTVDGWQVSVDEHNYFETTLVLNTKSKHIEIVAVDHNGKRDIKEFEYRIDGGVAATNIHSKGDRFERSRNPALDHLKYYALIIANQDYESEFVRDLETPMSDAESIGHVLKTRYGFEVEHLTNATKDDIEEAFERIFYIEENDEIESNNKDAILIYYAGHGFGSDSRNNNAYFWAPIDAQKNSPRTWYKTRELESHMQISGVPQIMVVADSCFAGSVLSRDAMPEEHASLNSRNWKKFLTEYTERKKSRYVLTSGGYAPVLDGGGGDHSVFARAFLNVLTQNNEIISASGVHEQVAPVVMDLAERQDFEQTPFFGYLRSAGHDFGNFYFPAPRFAADEEEIVRTSLLFDRTIFPVGPPPGP